MKVIFLDIDGVLNCQSSKSRCGSFIGIDNDKVKRLKNIVYETDAKIVLCSSWKTDWERINKEEQNSIGNYLDKKLSKEHLHILDKTEDKGSDRGKGINKWLNSHNIESWIVLDDEYFSDYEEFNIFPNLIKTNFYSNNGGLQDIHVEQAIEMMKGEENVQ